MSRMSALLLVASGLALIGGAAWIAVDLPALGPASGFALVQAVALGLALTGLVLVSAPLWPEAWRVAALVSAAALVFSVFAAEYGLSSGLLVPAAPPPPSGDTVDSRTRLQVVADLRRGGTDALPALLPSLVMTVEPSGALRSPLRGADGGELLPLAGPGDTVTVLCREGRDWAVFRSDQHGFRNPPAAWDQPAAALVVGDSFTQGACVADGDELPALLRPALGNVINLGVSGNGPLIELATLREYLALARPRLVVWLFFEENDLIQDLGRERQSPLLRRYLDPGFHQDLARRGDEIAAAGRDFLERGLAQADEALLNGRQTTETPSAWRSVLLLRGLRERLGLIAPPGRSDLALFRAIIEQAKAEAEAAGARFVLATLPGPRRFRSPGGRLAMELAQLRTLAALRPLTGLEIIDLAPVFAADPAPLTLFREFHYTEDGYRRIGRRLAEALQQ